VAVPAMVVRGMKPNARRRVRGSARTLHFHQVQHVLPSTPFGTFCAQSSDHALHALHASAMAFAQGKRARFLDGQQGVSTRIMALPLTRP
jgi:hypothetical protein